MKNDHISKLYPGFTVTLCFGKSGGFYIRWTEGICGICLWYMALTFYAYDTELALSALLELHESSKQSKR